MSSAFLLVLARSVLLALLFRGFPLLAYAMVSRRIAVADKVPAALLYVGASVFLFGGIGETGRNARELALVYAGFLVLFALAAPFCGRFPRRPFFRYAIASALFPMWLAIPVGLGETELAPALLLVSIDAGLSVASLLLSPTKDLALGDALFFVFVDPSLSVRSRARAVRAPAMDGALLGRALRGCIALALGALSLHFPTWLDHALPADVGPSRAALRFVALAFAICCTLYITHVGLADLQIGAVRALGFDLPERYVKPFAAVGPRDFWARWNVYMNAWLRDHVYAPLTHASTRTLGRSRANDLGIMATFVVSGALHALAVAATHRTLDVAFFSFFVMQGALMLAWIRVDRVVLERAPASPPRAYTWLSRTAFLVVLVLSAGVAHHVGTNG